MSRIDHPPLEPAINRSVARGRAAACSNPPLRRLGGETEIRSSRSSPFRRSYGARASERRRMENAADGSRQAKTQFAIMLEDGFLASFITWLEMKFRIVLELRAEKRRQKR
jgi:hypothetical protein